MHFELSLEVDMGHMTATRKGWHSRGCATWCKSMTVSHRAGETSDMVNTVIQPCRQCRWVTSENIRALATPRHAPSTSAAQRYRSACVSVFHATTVPEGSSGSYARVYRTLFSVHNRDLRVDILALDRRLKRL